MFVLNMKDLKLIFDGEEVHKAETDSKLELLMASL